MSHSVPTSPAVSRSSKIYPLTPQRPTYHQQRSLSLYRSPVTPLNSPYTPTSLRSVNSNGSSTLTTPDNSGYSTRKRLTFAGSPEVIRDGNTSKDKSLADIAKNWRSRTGSGQNKASYADHDDSGYVLDDSSDMSFSEVANDSSLLSDEAFLGAPFLSNNLQPISVPTFTTRPRAQSHAPIPSRALPQSPSNRIVSTPVNTSSPVSHRLGPRHCTSLMSTPPPNSAVMRQLKIKGSLTDPPQPRRREALGTVTIPSNNVNSASASMKLEPDTSLDLYDIDENEFEYEHDYPVDDSFSCDQPAFGYPTFPPPLPQQNRSQSFGQSNFVDPFHTSPNFSDVHNGTFLNLGKSVDHHFHAARQQQQPQHLYFNDGQQPIPHFFNLCLPPRFNPPVPQAYQPPTFVPIPSMAPLPATPIPVRQLTPNSSSNSEGLAVVVPPECSVCLAFRPASLAILEPCGHPLCSTCLTSALNIVGEKDMACAVCKQSVADFRLVMTTQKGNAISKFEDPSQHTNDLLKGVSLDDNPNPLIGAFQHASTPDHSGELESAFEFGLDLGELRASTPKTEQQVDRSHSLISNSSMYQESGEDVVLRIDNVPWDITPSQIKKWLQQPVERVHVLLDYKGKTLSHAYVEVKNAVTAGAILRGEALSSSGEKEIRGSVLGRGKRARGVTITKSGQPELMRDLFRHWRGGFDGSQPSLGGLESDRVICALEGSLLTESEITGLMQLIREPDSHFLKVPCLPFHSLMSLLNKFPSNTDGRVFCSVRVRDLLFDATYTAIQILRDRVIEAEQATITSYRHEEYTPDLLVDLFHSAQRCKAYTSQQIHTLTQLGEALSLPAGQKSGPFESFEAICNTSDSSQMLEITDGTTTSVGQQPGFNGSLDDLAKEFGVDAQVVQALAQRLSGLR